ncbi:hypothetical protein OG883_43570 [Streptomyces sp. NBC_01142]|uniref:hypothetical protein n=1 Tax=Streptomyces sp. NBC_01142 TaxID=2975865 RepID=UPI002254EAA3|nr:hypothetical protein [Streptomyces sp. NBC_01142]MCX4826520.1 hypothetical protein [Streptomyces sp. NBC_01142]
MSAIAWLRLSDDRLVRADRVIAVDLWGPVADNAEHTGPLTKAVEGQPARIVAQLAGPDTSWVHVATCTPVRGGELITGLLGALAAAAARPSGIAIVYGLRHGGELSRWTFGATIPLTDPRVVPFHEVRDLAPGRWLVRPLQRGGAQEGS